MTRRRGCPLPLVLLLLLGTLALTEGKKKKNKKQWADAWKKIEEEEMEEWEEEKAEREAEHAKYMDPMKMVDEMGATDAAAMMGGMGGGSSAGGPAMCFVHMKKTLTREATEEVVVKWRDLLYTSGFDIKPYVVEDQLVLLNMDEQYKVSELKNFVLDPYFAEDKVEAFEYNSKKWYPEGSEEDIKEKEKEVRFPAARSPHAAASRPLNGVASTLHQADVQIAVRGCCWL